MKKKNLRWIEVFLLSLMILGMVMESKTVSAEDTMNVSKLSIQKGDMDGNGIINLDDAKRMLRGVLMIEPFTSQEHSIADLYNDNQITLDDVQIVLRIALRMTDIEDVIPTTVPSAQPSLEPSVSEPPASQVPSMEPTATVLPTASPSIEPTATVLPTVSPSIEPTPEVSVKPATPPVVDADYADMYIQVIESYGYNQPTSSGSGWFVAINVNALNYVDETEIDKIVLHFEELGYNIKRADLNVLREEGCVEDYPGGYYNIINGVLIRISRVTLKDDNLIINGTKTWGGLDGIGYESIFEKQDEKWVLIETKEVMRS